MKRSIRAIIINNDKMVVMHRNKFGHEYYTLIGGGVDIREEPEEALVREIAEETGLQTANPRLVIIENDSKFYGPQYVYLCQYVGGEPSLSPNSTEAKINELGKNTYQPEWLPLSQLAKVTFMTPELQKVLLEYIPKGFPAEPVSL